MPTTFRKGDVVTIEATVEKAAFAGHDGKQAVKIKFPPYHDAFVDPSQLTMVRPVIADGDTIEWTVGEETYRGEVLAIADDHAWVHLGGGGYATVWLSNATRVDPEPEPVRSDGGADIVENEVVG